ncbi:MAG: FAD:protein FMN transferase, partial [Candidatus Altiarchaeales archaeon]|nr:FAD:protein FMN transferase [Candidatus Altiarchaeales archaeon]
ISVTVLAEAAVDADALATAIFVLGAEDGRLLAEKRGVDVLIITEDKEILKSQEFNNQ